jgi:hypothetical protein
MTFAGATNPLREGQNEIAMKKEKINYESL